MSLVVRSEERLKYSGALKAVLSAREEKSTQEKSHLSHDACSPPLNALLILQLPSKVQPPKSSSIRIRTDFFTD